MTIPASPAPQPPPQLSAVALNPVAIAWAANIAVALLSGFGLHLTRTQAGAAETAAAALVALFTAVAARPWYIPAITGAATSVLTACTAFGLRWDAEQISAAATALSVVLLLVAHSATIPAAAARRGLTATEIQLARHLAQAPGAAATLNHGRRRTP